MGACRETFKPRQQRKKRDTRRRQGRETNLPYTGTDTHAHTVHRHIERSKADGETDQAAPGRQLDVYT